MFSLLYGLWQYLFSKTELHILIIGLDYAGKTTLLEQLKEIYSKARAVPLARIPPTVGMNIARVDIKRCKIIFWDLGGQERLRVIWSKYYKESQGLVFLVDSADESRLDEARAALHSMQQHQDLQGIPILVLANKQDLETAISASQIQSRLGVDDFSAQACSTRGVSAYTKDGIEESMSWLVEQVKSSERYAASKASSI